MPDQPTWLARVPDILEALRVESAPPYLDRAAIERLFGLRRRQAITLLHSLGGYQLGRTFLVDRQAAIAFLEQKLAGEEWKGVQEQRQRVAEFLGQARLASTLPSITIPLETKLSEITLFDLPSGIHLRPGSLSVTFQNATDLVEKLFTLSQAFANDFANLEGALEHAADAD